MKISLLIGFFLVLVFGGLIVYQTSTRDPYTTPEPSLEVRIAEQKDAFFDNECLTSHQLSGVVGATQGLMTVSYPCDWQITDIRDDFFRIESADGAASLQWPVLDMGMHESALIRDMTVSIGENTYPAKEYRTDTNRVIRVVDVPLQTDGGYGGFLVSYIPSTHEDVLDAMFSILSF